MASSGQACGSEGSESLCGCVGLGGLWCSGSLCRARGVFVAVGLRESVRVHGAYRTESCRGSDSSMSLVRIATPQSLAGVPEGPETHAEVQSGSESLSRLQGLSFRGLEGLGGIPRVLQGLREAQCRSLGVTVAGKGPFFTHCSPSQRLPQLPDSIEILCNSEASAAATLETTSARSPG